MSARGLCAFVCLGRGISCQPEHYIFDNIGSPVNRNLYLVMMYLFLLVSSDDSVCWVCEPVNDLLTLKHCMLYMYLPAAFFLL